MTAPTIEQRAHNIKEAARIIGVARRTLYRMIDFEIIPAFKLHKNGEWMLTAETIDNILAGKYSHVEYDREKHGSLETPKPQARRGEG